VSQPEQQPRFFLDRSLGRKAVPEALRADGWELITLAEHYGMPADEQVADTEWIEEAAKHGWPILGRPLQVGGNLRHRGPGAGIAREAEEHAAALISGATGGLDPVTRATR
jgi:hypothetical protein